MPFLYFLTYVGISYFLYKKSNKDNAYFNLKLLGLLPFVLLFIYLSAVSNDRFSAFEYLSVLILIFLYIIVFIINLFYFSDLFKLKEIKDNSSILDTIFLNYYYISIIIIVLIFIFNNKASQNFNYYYNGSSSGDFLYYILVSAFLIFLSLWNLFSKKLFS